MPHAAAAGPTALAHAVHPAFAAAALLLLALAWRTFRIGIAVGADGVVVRNVLRDRRLAWEEVERFELGDWWGFPIGGGRSTGSTRSSRALGGAGEPLRG